MSPMLKGEASAGSASGGFARGDPEVGRTVDVERANYWFGLKQVPNRFMHLLVLGAVILLRIFFGVPKAQCQHAIVLFLVGDEDCLIHEALLLLQDRQYFVIDGVGELSILAWL